MKLWLKITLICTGAMLIILTACMTVLLTQSSSRILEVTLDNAMTKQHNLAASFSSMVSYYRGDESETADVVEHAVVRYCFSRFADEMSILMLGGDVIYGGAGVNAADVLPITQPYEQQYFIGEVDGVHMLIVGSEVTTYQNTYTVYTAQDITATYQIIRGMIAKFILIGLAFTMTGIAAVTIMVRFAMNPLKELSGTVRRIASGGYDVRARIRTRDEVGALARDFNLMAGAVEAHVSELRERTQRQRIFIGGLTHEFKTPLTALIGHSETLLSTKQPQNVVDDSLRFIHERCEWLERLIQKLLKLITLGEELELKLASVPELLAEVREDVEETFKKRGVEMIVSCDMDYLPMDFDLLRSALINLCDNAAKASKPGQKVILAACDGVIEVADEGCGMAADQIAYITEPFYMIDRSRNKKLGGCGLGLALVRQIAQGHGARLQFESTVGQGTAARLIFAKTIC